MSRPAPVIIEAELPEPDFAAIARPTARSADAIIEVYREEAGRGVYSTETSLAVAGAVMADLKAGHLPRNIDDLLFQTEEGEYESLEFAIERGMIPADSSIWIRQICHDYRTVAHHALYMGRLPKTFTFWKLLDGRGQSVADAAIERAAWLAGEAARQKRALADYSSLPSGAPRLVMVFEALKTARSASEAAETAKRATLAVARESY